MNRTYVPSLNRHSPIATWEISPCLEELDPHGDGDTNVLTFESSEEAESEADGNYDLYSGPVFWGVYMNMREEVIDAGVAPTIHVQDFPTFDDALAFVTCVNGVPEVTYGASNDH